MVLGSVLLFRNQELYEQVSLSIILPVTLFFAAFFVSVLYLVIKTHRQSPVSGRQGLIGEKAIVYSWGAEGKGKVFCHGEYWNAKGPAGLIPDDQVEVVELDGLELIVKPSPEHDRRNELS